MPLLSSGSAVRWFLRFSLSIFLTVGSSALAQTEGLRCSEQFTPYAISSLSLKWPARVQAELQPSFDNNLAHTLIIGAGGLEPATVMTRNAVRFLTAQRGLSTTKLIRIWEKAIPIIQDIAPKWEAVRLVGSDGASIYRGQFGYSLIFTRDGKIYKGYIDDDQIIDGVWNADYSRTDMLSLVRPTSY